MNETYEALSDHYITAREDTRDQTLPPENPTENKLVIVENAPTYPSESQWLQKAFQCSGCQTLVPHNNLFVCSKPNCQFAMNSTRTIESPGELYSAEAVFCGLCSFRGIHSAHQKHMRDAEPLAIEKASTTTGCMLQRQFDDLTVLDNYDTIEYAIHEQRVKEMREKPKVQVVDYLKNSKDSLEWTQRMQNIQGFVNKVKERRQRGRDHIGRLINKELQSFKMIEDEIKYDVITKKKAIEEAEKKKYADHAMNMSMEDKSASQKSTSSSKNYTDSEKSQSIHSYVTDQARLLEQLDNEVGGFGDESTPTKHPPSSESEPQYPSSEQMYDLHKLSQFNIEYTTPEEQNIQMELSKSFKVQNYRGYSGDAASTSQKTWGAEQKASKEAIRLMQDEYLQKEREKAEKEPWKYPASTAFDRRPVAFNSAPEKTLKVEDPSSTPEVEEVKNPPDERPFARNKPPTKFGEGCEPIDMNDLSLPGRRGPSEWLLKSTGQWDAYQEKQKAMQNRQNNSYRYQKKWNSGNYHGYQNRYQAQSSSSELPSDKKWEVNCREIHSEWNRSRQTEEEFHQVTAKSNGYGLRTFLKSTAGNEYSEALKQTATPSNFYQNQRPLCPPPSVTRSESEEQQEDDSDDTFSEATQKYVPVQKTEEVWRHPSKAFEESPSLTDSSCTLLMRHFEYIRDSDDLETALIKIAHKLDGMENLTTELKKKVSDMFRERTSFRIYWPIPVPSSDDN